MEDFMGQQVSVGDTVVYNEMIGKYSREMRIGMVVKVTECFAYMDNSIGRVSGAQIYKVTSKE